MQVELISLEGLSGGKFTLGTQYTVSKKIGESYYLVIHNTSFYPYMFHEKNVKEVSDVDTKSNTL